MPKKAFWPEVDDGDTCGEFVVRPGHEKK